MSMKSWSEAGYGYELFNDNNWKNIVDFILRSTTRFYTDEQKKEMYELEDEYELEDIIDNPVAWTVADYINKVEGLTIFKGYQSCGDTNQEAMIGIEPCYPWNMTTNDMITQDEANELLTKYAEILGITEAPNYFEAEYFG